MNTKLLAIPEHIALRVRALGQQAIHQTDRLGGFAVIDGERADAGLFLERPQNRFSVFLVLGGINNDFR